MRKISILLLVAFLLGCFQDKNLVFINDLPFALNESSGVEFVKNTNSIWTHNDSGNEPILYELSPDGELLREVKVDAKNNDWEDITSDPKGNLYIGDFGNNYNERKNLRIYKVDQKDLEKKKVKVEKIKFSFEDQKKFPPKGKKRIFDAEGFFYFSDYLYIFTKSRIKKKIGKTNLYRIPAKEGKHIAKKIGTFENCPQKGCWITGADISDDGSKMVLISENNLILFTKYTGDKFFEGTVTKIPFEYQSQKEAVCFKDNETVIITDERTLSSGGNLYELKLPKN